jgi:copper chaperone NosL
MKAYFERSNQFLQRTLDWQPRALLVAAALLLLPAYLLPLWEITPAAGSGGSAAVRIYSDRVETGSGPDGPSRDQPANAATLDWLPFVIGVIALLFLRAPVHGRLRDLVDVSVLYVYFCAFALWSFEKIRGSDVPRASRPASGGYFLAAVAVVLALALALAWRQARTEHDAEIRAAG